nr:uncharacterized protein LOC106678140 [Halyomorpha halys]
MSKPKLSNEEKSERRKIRQRNYYLKRKVQQTGKHYAPYRPKEIDLKISAEIIQKNWVRIQRTVFREDVINYFVQSYRRKYMENVSENDSNLYPLELQEAPSNQNISAEPEQDLKGELLK